MNGPGSALPEIVLVVAAADNGVIGDKGRIPWHLPADLRHFRGITMGHPLLMGRKTFESIGRPLPGRRNIVLSRQPRWSAEGVEVAADFAAALRLATAGGTGTLMVIGGGELYAEARPLAQRIELTRVHLSLEGDALFAAPEPKAWRLTASADHAAEGAAPAFRFETHVRADVAGGQP